MSNLRWTRRNCALAVCLLTILAVTTRALVTMEPRFEGKYLSYWMDQLPSIDNGQDGRSESIRLPGSYSTQAAGDADLARLLKNIAKAHKALDTIGTNHLAIVVARLQLHDTALKTTLWNWTERLRLIEDATFRSARFRQGQAKHAFSYLRARARPALPQLLELTTNANTNTQLAAWFALEVVAPDEFHKRKHPPIMEHGPQR